MRVPRPKRFEIIASVVVAVIVLIVVAFAAGAQSAGHMFDWARLNGEPHWRSVLFPVSVDGAIIAATVVLYVDHRLNRPGHVLAYVLLTVGLAVSVLANVMHDWQQEFAGRAISAIGPLALFGIFHLTMQFVRSLAGVFAWASEPDRADHPHVFTWPEPIGPRLPAEDEFARDLSRLVASGAPLTHQLPAVAHSALPARTRTRPVRRSRPGSRVAGRRAHTTRPQPVLESTPRPPAQPPALEEPKVPAAALNGTPNPRVSAPTKPKPKPKRSQRNGRGVDDEHALQVWRSELAAGRNPSAQKFADLLGVSKATAARAQNRLQPRLNEARP